MSSSLSMRHCIASKVNDFNVGDFVSEGKKYGGSSAGNLVEVSPRTGSASYSYDISHISADPLYGPYFTLSVSYNSLDSTDRFFLGTGWTLNLTSYDKQTKSIVIDGASSSKVIFDQKGNPSLQYQKLKSIKLELASSKDEAMFVLTKQDGTRDYINKDGLMTKRCSHFGKCLFFAYDKNTNQLLSIFNLSKQKIELTHKAGNIVIASKRPDGVDYKTTLVVNNQKLVSILPSEDNTDQVSFAYNSDNLLIKLVNSVGATCDIKYTKLPLPGLNSVFMPAVEVMSIDPGHGKSPMQTKYRYGSASDSRNYLGFDSNVQYLSGQDNLFLRNGGYQYFVSIDSGNNTRRLTFNKFHLLVSDQLVDQNGNELVRRDLSYPFSVSKSIEKAPSNYQFPIQIVTKHCNLGSNKCRSSKVSSVYDGYGNLIEKVDESSRKMTYTYCNPDSSLPECSNFKKMGWFPSILVGQSLSSNNGKDSFAGKISYYDFAQGSKNSGIVLPSVVSFTYNSSDIKKQEKTYIDDMKSTYYSYPKSQKISSGSSSFSSSYSYSSDTEDLFRIQRDQDKRKFYTDISKNYSPSSVVLLRGSNSTEQGFNYDSFGRVISEKKKVGGKEVSTSVEYVTKRGANLQHYIYSNGNKIKTALDGFGRVIAEYRHDGSEYFQISSYEYDRYGNLITKVEINRNPESSSLFKKTTRYKYDAMNRKSLITLPSGLVQKFVYNDGENSVEEHTINASGDKLAVSKLYYNDGGNLIKKVIYDKNGHEYYVAKYEYDGFGNKITEDVNGSITQWIHDYAKNSTSVKRGNKSTINSSVVTKTLRDRVFDKDLSLYIDDKVMGSIQYNSLGDSVSYKDAAGGILRLNKYNDLNLLETVVYGNNNTETNTYSEGLLSQRRFYSPATKEAQELNFTYDSNLRLQSVSNPSDQSEMQYSYNLDGSVATEKAINGNNSVSIKYIYDAIGNLYQVAVNNDVITYVKNAFGQISSKKHNGREYISYTHDGFDRLSAMSIVNGVNVSYKYDEFSRIVLMHYAVKDKIDLSYMVGYSNLNQITSLNTVDGINNVKRSEVYKYDDLSRLTNYNCKGNCHDGHGSYSVDYKYDKYNNILLAVHSYGSTVRILKYEYDLSIPTKLLTVAEGIGSSLGQADKNLKIIRKMKYDGANIASDGVFNYSYNSRNLLSSVSGNGHTSGYLYDINGKIFSKTFDSRPAEHSYYIKSNRILIKDGEKSNFILSNNAAITVDQDGKYHNNIYSPTGNVAAKYSPELGALYCNYLPFGLQSATSGKRCSTFGYQGNSEDLTSGLLVYGDGTRFYSPELGRFIMHDSMSPFDGGGANGYAYASNNPINIYDPSGHFGIFDIIFNVLMIAADVLTEGATVPLHEAASVARVAEVGSEVAASSVVKDVVADAVVASATEGASAEAVGIGSKELQSSLLQTMIKTSATRTSGSIQNLVATEEEVHGILGSKGISSIFSDTEAQKEFFVNLRIQGGKTSGKAIQSNVAAFRFSIGEETGEFASISGGGEIAFSKRALTNGYDEAQKGFFTFNPLQNRSADTERMVLEIFSKNIKDSQVVGSIDILSERAVCMQCQGAISNFEQLYPGIKINTYSPDIDRKFLQTAIGAKKVQ